jgi:phage-related protein (TIGR01555 family)
MSNRRRPAPAAAPAPAAPKRNPLDGIGLAQLSQLLAKDQADGLIPRREFDVPALPPGVIPKGATAAIACDSAVSMNGWLNQSGGGYCGLGFPGYTYLAELAQRSEYRAPSEVTAQEMTREWVEINGATESELADLTKAAEDFGVREVIAECILKDGMFGRAQLAINIKGQETDQRRKLPLIVDDDNKASTIPKGSLLGFKCIEPIWTTPYMYNSYDPTLPDFYKPQAWYVLGKQTHASRLLTFIGHPLPDILKPAYNFSGMSMSQLVEPYVIRWLKTVDSVNRMISNYSTSGIMTNLMSTLEEQGLEAGGMSLFKRAAMFAATRDNRGVMLLDKDSEEFFQYNTPLSGLSELQAQAQEHMAAPTHIPLVKLTGVTPAGLNASSDGEIKVWYDYVGGRQKDYAGGHLKTVYKILQLHLWGKVNPKISFEWTRLDSPTDKEESEMRKADSDRDGTYVSNAVVSPDEVRQRLRNDKNSGYTFLQGPAPAPELDNAELDEEGKDKDHARTQEAAEADHARAKDLESHKAKVAPKPAAGKK